MITIKFLKHLSPGSNRELLDFQSQMWPSRLFSGKQDQNFEVPITV